MASGARKKRKLNLIGIMEEEDSFQDAKPKKRSREAKKEEKRKKKSSSVQEASPEGGKSSVQSPAIHLSHFASTSQGEPNVSVSVTPLHVIEELAPKGVSTPIGKNPAAHQRAPRTLRTEPLPGSSQPKLVFITQQEDMYMSVLNKFLEIAVFDAQAEQKEQELGESKTKEEL